VMSSITNLRSSGAYLRTCATCMNHGRQGSGFALRRPPAPFSPIPLHPHPRFSAPHSHARRGGHGQHSGPNRRIGPLPARRWPGPRLLRCGPLRTPGPAPPATALLRFHRCLRPKRAPCTQVLGRHKHAPQPWSLEADGRRVFFTFSSQAITPSRPSCGSSYTRSLQQGVFQGWQQVCFSC
jgi:hypothetical protein